MDESVKNTYSAIVCPGCGSNKISALEDDQYLCNSCQTIFGLDKKKISVEVNHRHTGMDSFFDTQRMYFVQIALGALIIIPACIFAFAGMFSRPSSTPANTGTYTAKTDIKKEQADLVKHRATYTYTYDSKIYFATLSESRKEDTLALYVTLFDTNHRIIAYQKIDEKKIGNASIRDGFDTAMKKIGNTLFVISEKQKIFGLNPINAEILGQNTEYEKNIPEFAEGIAIASLNSAWGDSIEVTTASGDKYYWYPTPNERVKSDAIGDRVDTPSAKQSVYYTFFTKGSGPTEKYYLQRIQANIDTSGPYKDCYRCLELDFAEKSSNTTYIGYVPSPQNIKKDYFMTDVLAILPDRNFLSPEILSYTDTQVLVLYKTNVTENAPMQMQLISTDGKILFSQETKGVRSSSIASDMLAVVDSDNQMKHYTISSKSEQVFTRKEIEDALYQAKIFIP